MNKGEHGVIILTVTNMVTNMVTKKIANLRKVTKVTKASRNVTVNVTTQDSETVVFNRKSYKGYKKNGVNKNNRFRRYVNINYYIRAPYGVKIN